jgi:hypothetical protein
MKPIEVVVLAMLIGWAGPAAAGPADDEKTIAQCVVKAAASDQFPGACIGVVADPCIRNAGAPEAASACAKRELAVWRGRMTKAMALIGKGGPKDMVAALAKVQKTFAIMLDGLCPQLNGLDPGMSMGGEDYCRLQETARHALLLERLAAAVSEH